MQISEFFFSVALPVLCQQMSLHNLKRQLKMTLLRNSHIFKLVSTLPKRNLSNLEPVHLAYTRYENTEQKQPPLIVNHGLFGSKSNWNSLCKAYQRKTPREIIAVDARNHGDSPHTTDHSYQHLVLDLKNLINELKMEKVALLGHSMGGRTVMYFALKYPQLVEKLIVADISPVRTSPNLRRTPELFHIMKSVELPQDVTLSVARSQVDSQLTQFVDDKGLRSFLLTNLVQNEDKTFTWRINVDTLMSNFEHLASFPQIENLKYDGPVLFIGGGNSDYISKSDHSEILKLFPQAQFEYIEGAGHWLHSEKPTEFLERTVTFLNER